MVGKIVSHHEIHEIEKREGQSFIAKENNEGQNLEAEIDLGLLKLTEAIHEGKLGAALAPRNSKRSQK